LKSFPPPQPGGYCHNIVGVAGGQLVQDRQTEIGMEECDCAIKPAKNAGLRKFLE
jgi:hypothetical protein